MEFRYAMVRNAPSVLSPDTAKAWVIRYPLGDDVDSDFYGDVGTCTLLISIVSEFVHFEVCVLTFDSIYVIFGVDFFRFQG